MASLSIFLVFFPYSLKQATVLSLLAIASGAVCNWILNAREVMYRRVLVLVLCSYPGSHVGAWLKVHLPISVQKLFLIVILLSSARTFWKQNAVSDVLKAPLNPHWIVFSLCGLALGCFATLTGLGGGVILMPLLLRIGIGMNQALATSYFCTSCAALMSLKVQWAMWKDHAQPDILLSLLGGVIVGIFFLTQLRKYLAPAKFSHLRRVVFAVVVLFALTGVLLRG